MNPAFKKRLNNEWIAVNLFGWEVLDDGEGTLYSTKNFTVPDYLSDYELFGLAWQKLIEHYDDIDLFVAPDGVYQVNHTSVVYSGHAYDYRVQLIWSIEDCECYSIPKTPMACIYGAIIDLILENS